MKCNFCEEQEATHFNTEWDAYLCDECADAQDEMVAAAKVSDLPAEWQKMIEEEKDR